VQITETAAKNKGSSQKKRKQREKEGPIWPLGGGRLKPNRGKQALFRKGGEDDK